MNTDDFWANNSLKERESYLDGGRLIKQLLNQNSSNTDPIWERDSPACYNII